MDSSQPKPQSGWKTTTIYSLQKGAGQTPVTKVFTQSGEGRHPHLAPAHSNQDSERSRPLSRQLERLLAGVTSTQQGISAGEAPWPKGKLHYLSYIRPAPTDHAEPQSQVAFGSKTPRPNLDRLLFKAGSNRLTAKEPLSVMDGKIRFIVACYRYFSLWHLCMPWLHNIPDLFVLGKIVFFITPVTF